MLRSRVDRNTQRLSMDSLMHKATWFLTLILLVTFSSETLAESGEAPFERENWGYRAHDGFFVRLTTGPGYQMSHEEHATISGGAAGASFAVGYAVFENFILHISTFGSMAVDPVVEIDGLGSDIIKDASANHFALAAGATWYFMPINIYVTASTGAARSTFSYKDYESNTEIGYAFDVMVGKEWWVGNEWGIGVALQMNYFDVPHKIADKTYDLRTFAGALLFSATYN